MEGSTKYLVSEVVWQFGVILFGNLAGFCLAIWRDSVWQFGGILFGNVAGFCLAIWRDFVAQLQNPVSIERDKNKNKPLVLDAKCLLRAIDAVALRNFPKQASRFSDAYHITLSGFASSTRR